MKKIDQREFDEFAWHESNDWEQRDEVIVGSFIACLILATLAIIFN